MLFTKFQKIVGISCAFFVSLLGIGYASLSEELNIIGLVGADTQEDVYIVDAKSLSINAHVNNFTSSILNSTIDLKELNTATFEILVFNNASETFGFNAVKYIEGEGTYDNTDIVFHLENLERKQEIESKAFLTFQVVFSFKEDIVIDDTILNSVLNFEFLPLDELPDDDSGIAATDVQDRFKEILNNTVEHNQLINQLNDSWNNGRWFDTSYIGNVVGASEEDKALIESLFAGNLSININGSPKEVKIMIKRENIDGSRNSGDSSGREMTIYMTSDPLTDAGGDAIVYASVYTRYSGQSEWVRIKDMFEGECTIVSYSGSNGTGSFNTDTWRSTASNGQNEGRTITQMIS